MRQQKDKRTVEARESRKTFKQSILTHDDKFTRQPQSDQNGANTVIKAGWTTRIQGDKSAICRRKFTVRGSSQCGRTKEMLRILVQKRLVDARTE